MIAIERKGVLMNFWTRLKNSALKNETRVALMFHEKEITYKELFSRANNYACELSRRGIDKNDVVCILGQRSIELFACILGILQVGAAFLLIDSDDEWSKVEYRIINSNSRYVFVDERYQRCDLLPETINLQEVYKKMYSTFFCNNERNAENTMYLAYTSGSTENEKAVEVSDGNLESYIDSFISVFSICEADVNVQQTPLGYDGLCEELFSMLLTGGRLLLLDKRVLQSPLLFHKELLRNKVTLLPTTPLILNELNKMSPVRTIKRYISCADVLKKYHYSNLVKYAQVFNTYGPTETTVCATYYLCSSEDDLYTPIGKPFPSYKVFIVSDDLSPVRQGQTGEILIGGKGVAKGYYNQNMLTKQKFVYLNGERVFRTGDYGYCDSSGVLHFSGRRDFIEKLKGVKVDCSKIENALICSGLVNTAIAHVCSDNCTTSLCVFYIPVDENINEETLINCLKRKLSADHLPKTYIAIDNIPQKSVGKVDYSALESLYCALKSSQIPITGKDINAFLAIFQNVLNKRTLSLESSLHDIGIDSISFVQIVVKLEELYGFEFDDEMLSHRSFKTIKQVYKYVLDKVGKPI